MQFIKTKFYLNKDDKTVTADIFNNGVFIETLKFSYELLFDNKLVPKYEKQNKKFRISSMVSFRKLSAEIKLIEKHDELFLLACANEKALLLYGTTDDFIRAIIAKAKAFVEHEFEHLNTITTETE